MKEWQVRQAVYHRLNKKFADEYGPDDIEMMEDQSDPAVTAMVYSYMSGYVPEKVIYPAKSYFVALVYARLIRDNFQEEPLEVLDDHELLYGNDPYFRPYSSAKGIYDAVLNMVGWDFPLDRGEIPDVAEYFREEFMLTRYGDRDFNFMLGPDA